MVNDGKKVPVVSLDPPYIHNGRKWVRADPSFVNGDISESARDIQWHHKTSLGEQVCGANPKFRNMTRLEALLHMFPPNQLDLMLKSQFWDPWNHFHGRVVSLSANRRHFR